MDNRERISMIDYNKKYIFIALEDSWFKKGTECIVEDGYSLWDSDEPNSYKTVEVSYERMVDRPDRVCGIFRGLRIAAGPPGELQEEGEEYEDGEVCVLDDFEVIKR